MSVSHGSSAPSWYSRRSSRSLPRACSPAGFGMDETFSRTNSAGTKHLLTDGLGSTLALTDPFGLPTTTYAYDPFGGTTQQRAASDNTFQYTGRENDGTGLQYNRNRYYHPGMGRFISPDPVGLAGGDSNLYAYVGNDPLNATDPLGLYMEINDHLIVTPGGPHITRPYEWMSPLDQVFSGPFAPPLVGWDSYRYCVWGKFADHGCTPSDNDDIGDAVSDAWGGAKDGAEIVWDAAEEINRVARPVQDAWDIGKGVGKSGPGRCLLVGAAGAIFGGWIGKVPGAIIGGGIGCVAGVTRRSP
jgi:RHS repeat-associated protein